MQSQLTNILRRALPRQGPRREQAVSTSFPGVGLMRREPQTLSMLGVVVGLLAFGCAGGPAHAIHEARQSQASATATARLTLDAWAQGEVTSRFAGLAFEAARTSVERERTRLATRATEAGTPATAAALADLETLSAGLARLATAAADGALATARALAVDLPEPSR